MGRRLNRLLGVTQVRSSLSRALGFRLFSGRRRSNRGCGCLLLILLALFALGYCSTKAGERRAALPTVEHDK